MSQQRTPDPSTHRDAPGQSADVDNPRPEELPEEVDLDESSVLDDTDDLTGVGRSDVHDDEARENR